jgi:hypothetical protein
VIVHPSFFDLSLTVVLIWFEDLVWIVGLNVKLQTPLRKIVVTDHGLSVAVDPD